jgi:hypothetical protein
MNRQNRLITTREPYAMCLLLGDFMPSQQGLRHRVDLVILGAIRELDALFD